MQPVPVRAQTAAQAPKPAVGRIRTLEFGAGLLWTGGASFGRRDAAETTGSGNPFVLFSTSTELAAAWGVDARVGVPITRSVQLDASSSYSHPQLQTRITADVENGPDITVGEPVHQFTIGGDVLFHLERLHVGRGVPFVSAGAGYLRQMHGGGAAAAAGPTYAFGAGMKYLLAGRSRGVKGIGIRADLRARVRPRAIAVDDRTHTSPELAALMFVRF